MIDLPEEFTGREVEIIVLATGQQATETPAAADEIRTRLATIQQFAGIARYDNPVDEDEYYNQ